ncbi:MAG: hypothetical protein WDO13_01505 [Verrucomicrobiota bacterium]
MEMASSALLSSIKPLKVQLPVPARERLRAVVELPVPPLSVVTFAPMTAALLELLVSVYVPLPLPRIKLMGLAEPEEPSENCPAPEATEILLPVPIRKPTALVAVLVMLTFPVSELVILTRTPFEPPTAVEKVTLADVGLPSN